MALHRREDVVPLRFHDRPPLTHAGSLRAPLELDLAKRPAKRENNIAVLAVGTVLERWLEHAEQFEGRSPSTLREYRRLVAVELLPAVGAFKIEDLLYATSRTCMAG